MKSRYFNGLAEARRQSEWSKIAERGHSPLCDGPQEEEVKACLIKSRWVRSQSKLGSLGEKMLQKSTKHSTHDARASDSPLTRLEIYELLLKSTGLPPSVKSYTDL